MNRKERRQSYTDTPSNTSKKIYRNKSAKKKAHEVKKSKQDNEEEEIQLLLKRVQEEAPAVGSQGRR